MFNYQITMKRLVVTAVIAVCSLSLLQGQVTDSEKTLRQLSNLQIEGWDKGANIIINFSETGLVNWAAGGKNSFSITSLLNAHANYKKDNFSWENALVAGYGTMKKGGEKEMIKTDDRFEISSKVGSKASDSFYYAFLLNFKTQFTIGKNYQKDTTKISNFFSPAYTTAAAGMDYKPNKYFSAFMAPVTYRMTIVTDKDLSAAGSYKVEPGKHARHELGGYIRLAYSRSDFEAAFLKNMGITTKVDLFSNYLNKPQNIDIDWETIIMLKFNDYISMNLTTHLIYDDDIKIAGKDGVKRSYAQFKEIFGVGFSYNF